MDSQEFEKALADPSAVFDSPEVLCHDRNVPREQKLKLLQQWEYDLQMLMVASEENMPAPSPTAGTGRTAELLRSVRKAVAQLGVEVDSEKGGGAKAGSVLRTEA